jgi:hypothetical protein
VNETPPLPENRWCSRCGASIQPDANFCQTCGVAVPKPVLTSEGLANKQSKSRPSNADARQQRPTGSAGLMNIDKGLIVAALLAGGAVVIAILVYLSNEVQPIPTTAATPRATPSQVESSVPPVPETPAATPTPTPYASILKEGIANMNKIEVPSDANGIVICATTFHAFAKVAVEAEQNDPSLKKLAAAYRAELSRTQVAMFPKLRKAWAEYMNEKMWEANVTVNAKGPRNQTLKFVGGYFASNANIKSTEDTLHETINALRFKRTEYSWIPDADGWAYTILTPEDKAISTEEL